jgi:hypothetical protein
MLTRLLWGGGAGLAGEEGQRWICGAPWLLWDRECRRGTKVKPDHSFRV